MRTLRASLPLLVVGLFAAASLAAQDSRAPSPSGASPETPVPLQTPARTTPPTLQPRTAARPILWNHAVIEEMAADRSALRARSGGQAVDIVVRDPAQKAGLADFGEGDSVRVSFARDTTGQVVLQNLEVNAYEVPAANRFWALAASAVVLLVLFALLLGGRLSALLLGEDNRYSTSKFQVVLWFLVLLAAYLATTWFRTSRGGPAFVGGVNIPPNLLLLSGLSALTFAAAKGITQGKVDSGQVKTEATRPRFPRDLFEDDQGRVDVGDFQMVIATLLAVGVYLVTIYGYLGNVEFHSAITLPDVDSTILASFGLGQGAYLAKKYVTPTSPTPGTGGGGASGGSPPPAVPAGNPAPNPGAAP